MERSSFAILFFIRDSRVKKDGTVYIEVILSVNGERCSFSTGKKVKATSWDKTRQLVKGKDDEAKSLNNFLKAVRSKLYEKEAELMDKGFVVTAELLRNAYFDKVNALKEKTLFQVLTEHIIDSFERVDGHTHINLSFARRFMPYSSLYIVF